MVIHFLYSKGGDIRPLCNPYSTPVEPLHYTQSWEQVTCGGCRRANRELNS